MHLAAKYGNIKVARLLISKDAPVDAQGKNNVTPLHCAAHYDHVNVALLLLEKGASPHATAKNGYCPLHIAARKNQMDIATTLLEYGAKANAESKVLLVSHRFQSDRQLNRLSLSDCNLGRFHTIAFGSTGGPHRYGYTSNRTSGQCRRQG